MTLTLPIEPFFLRDVLRKVGHLISQRFGLVQSHSVAAGTHPVEPGAERIGLI